MNVWDVLVAVLLILAFVIGYRKGLISQLLSVAGSIAALITAFWFADDLSPWLEQMIPLQSFAVYARFEPLLNGLGVDTYIIRTLSFTLIFMSVKVLIMLAGKLINTATKAPGINGMNRWLGALLCIAEVFVLLLIGFQVLTIMPSEIIQKMLITSVTAPYFLEWIPVLINKLMEFSPLSQV